MPPVHVVAAFAGVATSVPAGRLSVKSRRVAGAPLALLSMVNVRVLTPPTAMEAGAKFLLNPGGVAVTVRVSDADPLLPNVDVRSPDVFAYIPGRSATVSTETVQLAAAATVPPEYDTVPVPDTAVRVPPEHELIAFAGAATNNPAGRLSVKSRLLAAAALAALSMVNVSVLTPPTEVEAGAKALLNSGGVAVTVRVSEAVPLLPKADVRSPDVFAYIPGMFAVVSTETVQLAAAGTRPPVYVMTPDPEAAVRVPPVQVVDAFDGVATIRPDGRLSVKSNALLSRVLALLSTVNVKVDALPTPTVDGAKALLKPGATAFTSRVF